jgi:hypothetical protein
LEKFFSIFTKNTVILERKITIRIVAFNLIIASFIILDLYLPGKEQEIEKLSSFYSFTKVSGSSKTGRTADEKRILELSNGERYRIGKFPEKEYSKDSKIIIIESALSNNVNEIKIFDNKWEKIGVGLFSNISILAILLLSLLITTLNIYYNNKALNIGLILSMMYIGIISMIYNFVF